MNYTFHGNPSPILRNYYQLVYLCSCITFEEYNHHKEGGIRWVYQVGQLEEIQFGLIWLNMD